jgi:hypothetical protein
MSILALTSDTLIGTPATGNLEYNGQFFGTDSNSSRAQMQRIVQATAVASTSGTSIDFTSIPSWVKRITVMFNGVSTVTTSNWLIQLGDSGGIENTGYTSLVAYTGAATGRVSSTSGFVCVTAVGSQVVSGQFVITLVSGNVYVQSGCVADGADYVYVAGGTKTLSATLDRVRITTAGGTDTFDAGSVNIMYEG